jgi:methionine aminotransferase
MRQGLNQYPPMTGVPALREAVAAKIASALRARLRRRRASHDHGRRDAGHPTAILAFVHRATR